MNEDKKLYCYECTNKQVVIKYPKEILYMYKTYSAELEGMFCTYESEVAAKIPEWIQTIEKHTGKNYYGRYNVPKDIRDELLKLVYIQNLRTTIGRMRLLSEFNMVDSKCDVSMNNFYTYNKLANKAWLEYGIDGVLDKVIHGDESLTILSAHNTKDVFWTSGNPSFTTNIESLMEPFSGKENTKKYDTICFPLTPKLAIIVRLNIGKDNDRKICNLNENRVKAFNFSLAEHQEPYHTSKSEVDGIDDFRNTVSYIISSKNFDRNTLDILRKIRVGENST